LTDDEAAETEFLPQMASKKDFVPAWEGAFDFRDVRRIDLDGKRKGVFMEKAEAESKASADAGIKNGAGCSASPHLPYYCTWYRTIFWGEKEPAIDKAQNPAGKSTQAK
jgi:hypothetical protein